MRRLGWPVIPRLACPSRRGARGETRRGRPPGPRAAGEPSTDSAPEGACQGPERSDSRQPRSEPGEYRISTMTGRAETDAGVQVDPALIEAIALRVAELIRGELSLPARLLTPSEVAARFGVSRTWVYAHADELGAMRLGTGPKARLRFDAGRVTSAISPRTSNRDGSSAARRGPRCSGPSADLWSRSAGVVERRGDEDGT